MSLEQFSSGTFATKKGWMDINCNNVLTTTFAIGTSSIDNYAFPDSINVADNEPILCTSGVTTSGTKHILFKSMGYLNAFYSFNSRDTPDPATELIPGENTGLGSQFADSPVIAQNLGTYNDGTMKMNSDGQYEMSGYLNILQTEVTTGSEIVVFPCTANLCKNGLLLYQIPFNIVGQAQVDLDFGSIALLADDELSVILAVAASESPLNAYIFSFNINIKQIF